MTQVKMPDPYVFIDPFEWKIAAEGEGGMPCITTTQAEAYADARVRGALEEAATVCWEMQSKPEYGKDDKDRWLAIAEQRIRALIKRIA